ncbi:hypothetical protein HBH61_155700 [Parastagonospora nodorum]|nr:hypothetical protein HBI06_192380 [Parastagonospora nodorum]KAH4235448.1 hypothetical protein HBI05_148230 [Parastagonospora nodorum]KAH4805738.1 hypothetical protein HBH61_155700 [Parastagonospora nodorum]
MTAWITLLGSVARPESNQSMASFARCSKRKTIWGALAHLVMAPFESVDPGLPMRASPAPASVLEECGKSVFVFQSSQASTCSLCCCEICCCETNNAQAVDQRQSCSRPASKSHCPSRKEQLPLPPKLSDAMLMLNRHDSLFVPSYP